MSLATVSFETSSLKTMSLGTMSLRTMCLGTIVPRYNVPRNNDPNDNYSSRQLFHPTIVPLDNCSLQQLFLRSFTNGQLHRGRSSTPDDQNQGVEEHGLLQMIIRMIRPPLCSSVPLQMVICKEDGPPDDQHFSAQTDQRFKVTDEYRL